MSAGCVNRQLLHHIDLNGDFFFLYPSCVESRGAGAHPSSHWVSILVYHMAHTNTEGQPLTLFPQTKTMTINQPHHSITAHNFRQLIPLIVDCLSAVHTLNSWLNVYRCWIRTVTQHQALGHHHYVCSVLSEQLKTANQRGCSFITRMLDYMYQRQNGNKPKPPHNEHINPTPYPISPLSVCSDKPVEIDITIRPPAGCSV